MNEKAYETHAEVSHTDGYGARIAMTYDTEGASDRTLGEFIEQGVSLLLSLVPAAGWSGDAREALLDQLEWWYEKRQEEAAELGSEWERGLAAGKASRDLEVVGAAGPPCDGVACGCQL